MAMRVIPTFVHGVLDYLIGALLIVAPWVLGFTGRGAETWVPVALGVGAICYSLFTAYEMGAVSLLSMRAHLFFDVLNGLFLAVSPWLFGFQDQVYLPHLLLGIFEILVAPLTQTIPTTTVPHRSSREAVSH